MKFLRRITFFVILLSVYIPFTTITYATWSGSAYSPGETLDPECAPSNSACTVTLSFTASNGNIGIGSTTPWGKLSVNPNGITGPSFVVGSSTGTSFVIDNSGRIGIGTSSPIRTLDVVDTLGSFFPMGFYSQNYVKNGEITIGTDTNRQIGFNLPITSGGTLVGDGWVQFRYNAAGNKMFFGDTGSNSWIQSSHTLNFASLVSGPSTTTIPAMSIALNRNVGIGSTSPFSILSISNSVSTGADIPLLTIASTTAGTATTTAFTVLANGYIGIGTSTPIADFNVVGSNNVHFDRISADSSGPNLQFRKSRNFGIVQNNDELGYVKFRGHDGTDYRNSALIYSQVDGVPTSTSIPSRLTFWTTTLGNTTYSERMRIDSNGNIGIATTSPYAKLSVTSTGVGSTTLALRPVSAQTANILDIYSTGGTLTSVINSSGNWGIGTTSPQFNLDINGTLGVGTDASNSTYKVHLKNPSGSSFSRLLLLEHVKAGTSGVSSVAALKLKSSGDMIDTFGPGLLFTIEDTANTDNIIGRIASVRDGSDTSGALVFNVNSTLNEAMRINTAGNIGIGTTSPYSVLSISNSVSTIANTPLLTIASTTAGTATSTFMTVLANGNVGIATTSPSSLLSLKQSANTSPNGIWQSGTDGDFRSMYISDTSGTLSFFGGDTAGTLNTATLNSAGAWTNASDIAYKENIVDLDTKYNLNTLLSIKPRFYTMKGTGKPQIGFIAQELKPILPEVVEGTDGSMGISYGNMVALLVSAVKELNGKVDKLVQNITNDVKNAFGEQVDTKKLCLDNLCITRDELQRILNTTNVNGIQQSAPLQQNNNTNIGTTTQDTNTNNPTTTENIATSTTESVIINEPKNEEEKPVETPPVPPISETEAPVQNTESTPAP